MAENDMYFISRRNAENVRKKPVIAMPDKANGHFELIEVAFPRTFSTLDERGTVSRWATTQLGKVSTATLDKYR
ncbi:unnamed protein product, partial [Nesidiocoris tenuis]